MPSKKQVTIHDVAREAGVSPATVSRVLSQNAYVIDETKEKVLKAIKLTGYRVQSKSKEQSRQKNILLVICSSLRDQGSSYFLEGIERRASEAGYSAFIKHMVMSQIVHGSLNADTMMAWVRECGASGLLVFSDAVDVGSLLDISDQIPVVTMMTEYSNPRISSVDVDEEDMMRKCFRHLIATGKDRIALITGQMMYRRSQVLKECYHSLMGEMGLEENPNWCAVIDTNYYSTSAAIAAEQMLKNPDPPNAFITTADIYAAGVIYACSRLGLSMPDDVAVVGRDNSSICHVSIPQITAFNMPSEMIGYTACNSLIAKIENSGSNTRNIVVPCDLIIRGSTAKNNN